MAVSQRVVWSFFKLLKVASLATYQYLYPLTICKVTGKGPRDQYCTNWGSARKNLCTGTEAGGL